MLRTNLGGPGRDGAELIFPVAVDEAGTCVGQSICYIVESKPRVIIEGAYLAIEREESDAILPDRSVQRHSVTSFETACSLANSPSWGGGG